MQKKLASRLYSPLYLAIVVREPGRGARRGAIMRGAGAVLDDGEAWCEDEAEVLRTERLLLRAQVLRREDAAYFRSKPWKWSRERAYCLPLERAMAVAGVDPAEGWEMTLCELAALAALAESR
jgi:hypothetical protein